MWATEDEEWAAEEEEWATEEEKWATEDEEWATEEEKWATEDEEWATEEEKWATEEKSEPLKTKSEPQLCRTQRSPIAGNWVSFKPPTTVQVNSAAQTEAKRRRPSRYKVLSASSEAATLTMQSDLVKWLVKVTDINL